MNRWIVVLLLCVALYVGIILVRGFTTTVAQPDRQAQQEIRTQQMAMTHPKLVVSQMSDSVGNTIVNLGLNFGSSSPTLQKPPTFEIRDANGKRIYQGRFEFGWGGSCTHSWRVPEEVKGDVTVHVTSLETNEKITVEDVTFTIDKNATPIGQ